MIDHPELWAGLSPRVRGSRGEHRAGAAYDGSIPTCAGEPSSSFCLPYRLGVYPRVCGGAVWERRPPVVFRGLSPRVRGSR